MKKININTATQKELEELPGIGPKIAENIISYRKANHPFSKIEDLLKVDRITLTVFKKIKDRVSVSQAPAEEKTITTTEDPPNSVLHFFGYPGRLTLRVPIGRVAEKKKIAIKFENSQLTTSTGCSLNELVFYRKVFPCQEKELKLRLPLSKSTPPGVYEMMILIDEEKYPAQLEIMEKIAASISPVKVYLEAPVGTSLEKTFFITNRGNMPLSFKDPGAIALETDSIECRVIRATASQVNNRSEVSDLIGVVSAELEKLYKEAGFLRASVQGEAVSIPAGETQRVTLKFTIPRKLQPGGYYTGSFRFYNSTVLLIVLPQA